MMSSEWIAALEAFIVQAKAATYIGDGTKLLAYRQGSIDLQVQDGDWAYHDSYFGGIDFPGQEIVYHKGEPVWAMNYFGRILPPDRIEAAEVGKMLKRSLALMYAEGRFLGAFEHTHGSLRYSDTNRGDVTWFIGRETIEMDGEEVYELIYNGGLIR